LDYQIITNIIICPSFDERRYPDHKFKNILYMPKIFTKLPPSGIGTFPSVGNPLGYSSKKLPGPHNLHIL